MISAKQVELRKLRLARLVKMLEAVRDDDTKHFDWSAWHHETGCDVKYDRIQEWVDEDQSQIDHIKDQRKMLNLHAPIDGRWIAPEIERWLVTDADKKFRRSATRLHASHGDDPIGM